MTRAAATAGAVLGLALAALLLHPPFACAGEPGRVDLRPEDEAPLPPRLAPPPDRSFLVAAQVDVATQLDPIVVQVYKRKGPVAITVRAGGLWRERLGLGFTVGLWRRTGVGVAPEGEPPDVALWQVPVSFEGTLRAALWNGQVATPYLRGGIDVVFAEERVLPAGTLSSGADSGTGTTTGAGTATDTTTGADAGADDSAGTDAGGPELISRWFGVKAGAHLAVGVQFSLPFPETSWDSGLTDQPFLDEIYLHVEGWMRAAHNFQSSGVDLSGVGLAVGVSLLF